MTCKDCINSDVCDCRDDEIVETIAMNLEGEDCKLFKDKSKYITIDDDFCTILICAERYALGRKSYMPKLVVDYITPLLKRMDTRSLVAIKRDLIEPEWGYGDEKIDKPLWINFLHKVENEIKERV